MGYIDLVVFHVIWGLVIDELPKWSANQNQWAVVQNGPIWDTHMVVALTL